MIYIRDCSPDFFSFCKSFANLIKQHKENCFHYVAWGKPQCTIWEQNNFMISTKKWWLENKTSWHYGLSETNPLLQQRQLFPGRQTCSTFTFERSMIRGRRKPSGGGMTPRSPYGGEGDDFTCLHCHTLWLSHQPNMGFRTGVQWL